LIILASLLNVATAATTGAKASMDMDIIKEAKDVYFSYILNILKKVDIPDISFDGGYIKGNSFALTDTPKNVYFDTDVRDNGFELTCNDLEASFTSNEF